MGQVDRELRIASRRLKASIEHARRMREAGALLDSGRCEALYALVAQYDQAVVRRGGAPGASQLMSEALSLIADSDPLAALRAIQLDYIDRLTATCDGLMSAGLMPDGQYLNALGWAVSSFKTEHGAEDAPLLALAWDILAQAEAGLGEPTEDAHYQQAEQRYRACRRVSPPVLALVSSV